MVFLVMHVQWWKDKHCGIIFNLIRFVRLEKWWNNNVWNEGTFALKLHGSQEGWKCSRRCPHRVLPFSLPSQSRKWLEVVSARRIIRVFFRAAEREGTYNVLLLLLRMSWLCSTPSLKRTVLLRKFHCWTLLCAVFKVQTYQT